MAFAPLLCEITEDINYFVRDAVAASDVPDIGLRRILLFVSRVVYLVEQALTEVVAVLVEVKLLDSASLNREQLKEIRRRVELLDTKREYLDASDICRRLSQLNKVFAEEIAPVLNKTIPDISTYEGLWGLLEEHEGRIILIVDEMIIDLREHLFKVTRTSLPRLQQFAKNKDTELRANLFQLQNLKERILGLSGKPGLLELTSDRSQLMREVQVLIDNRDQSFTYGNKTSVVNSRVINSQIGSFKDIVNYAAQSSVDRKLKRRLTLFCRQFEMTAKDLPPKKRKLITQDLQTVVLEATKSAPNKRQLKSGLNRLANEARAHDNISSVLLGSINNIKQLLCP